MTDIKVGPTVEDLINVLKTKEHILNASFKPTSSSLTIISDCYNSNDRISSNILHDTIWNSVIKDIKTIILSGFSLELEDLRWLRSVNVELREF